MTIKVDVETVDPLRRRLSIEVPAAEVSAAINGEYARLSKAARVPGFRPGRAPRHVLQQLFGERVRADVYERLIQQSLVEAVDGQGLEPVGRPEVVTQEARPGEALRYTATFEVKPDLVVKNYSGFEVERPIEPVSDAQVDDYLKHLRETMAQLRPITDRDVTAGGDVVRVDYEARTDGNLIGRGEGRDIQMGANGFPPEFDQNLVGASVGATVEFTAHYADDPTAGPLAGKEVAFRVKLHALFSKDLPALDDDFAKDQGDCSTLEELRGRIRKQLEERARERGDDEMRRALLRQLVSANEFEAPHAMIDRRIDAMIEETRQEWQRLGRWPRQDVALRERLHRDLHPQADFEVKVGLLLEAIARQENIEVGEEDVEGRIAAIAAQAQQAAEQVRAHYDAPEAKRHLRARMLQSRAIDAVVRSAKVRDVEKSSVADPAETG
jgi:trigger factor